MNKKTAVALGSVILSVAIITAAVVMYFRQANVPIVDEFTISESSISQKEEISSSYSVPPIKVEYKEIIEEPAAEKPEDTVPPPEVTEITEPDGTVAQTPNWEAQKELAPGTDLEDPEIQPEYVKPESSSSASAASSKTGSTPKNGDTKTINGETYGYVEGFGWIKAGNGGTTEYIDAPTTGNNVGY